MRIALKLAPLVAATATACASSPPAVPPPPSSARAAPSAPGVTATPSSGALTIRWVDVDQGDAILLQFGTTDILVDAGTASTCPHLLEVLKSVTGHLDLLAITHPHDDHYGCAAQVLGAVKVDDVITNGERRGPPRDPSPVPAWDEFEAALQRHQLKPRDNVSAGDIIKLTPGLILNVLSTGGQFPDTPKGSDINNDSLVLMVEFAGHRVLLTGDIEEARGGMLVRELCPHGPDDCPALRADVLKVPHHGSEHFDAGLFRAVHPAFAVVSAAYASKKHYLPRTAPIEALTNLGAKVYSTSAEGTEDVVLTVGADGAMTWSPPSGQVFAWTGHGGEERRFEQ